MQPKERGLQDLYKVMAGNSRAIEIIDGLFDRPELSLIVESRNLHRIPGINPAFLVDLLDDTFTGDDIAFANFLAQADFYKIEIALSVKDRAKVFEVCQGFLP